jgi:glycerol-3-phosphate acyltransferase PlsY
VPIFAYILTALAAYLLGSIPTGYLVGKAKGVDIRTVGSKNMGATNVFRTLGKGPGIMVLLVDGLKGWVAVQVVAVWAANDLLPYDSLGGTLEILAITAGIGAVLGHNYTCWLAFKGGKGIATTAGAYFALAPLSVTLALGVWILFFVSTRYVSVASIAAAVALPTAVWLTQKSLLLSIVTTVLGVMAIYKHKANIQRLRAGTENRVTFKKEKTQP